MTTLFKSLITFSLLFCISFSLVAQVQEQMDSIVKSHVAQGFNGNVLYAKNGQVLFTGNYGYANIEEGILLNDSTRFELASNSKQITAVAIIQLIEKGLLSYQSQADEILSSFPYKGITVEHLLRHQSGLPDNQRLLSDKKVWNRKVKADAKALLSALIVKNEPLEFPPGSKYDYSNTGYNILALIIEEISEMSYGQYLQENIFIPAKMKTAMVVSLNYDPENEHNSAQGYTFHEKKKRYQRAAKDKNHHHLNWMRTISGGAGIYASTLDIFQWINALEDNILISQESKELMLSTDNISKKYGHGVAIYEDTLKGKWVYHTGSWGGAKTMILYLPDSRELIVILSNNRYKNTYKTFDEELYNVISN